VDYRGHNESSKTNPCQQPPEPRPLGPFPDLWGKDVSRRGVDHAHQLGLSGTVLGENESTVGSAANRPSIHVLRRTMAILGTHTLNCASRSDEHPAGTL
jgi:hypothetical protein